MENIKTFEDACKVLNLDPKTCLPDVSGIPADDQDAITAHCKLIIIAKALNGDWTPDWSDHSQGKFYPWFDVKADKNNKSGLGLSYGDYVYSVSASSVGSRLSYRTRELATYAGKQFLEIYKTYFLYDQKVKDLKPLSGKALVAHKYCESKGWSTDLNDLSLDQIAEIRSISAWKAAV